MTARDVALLVAQSSRDGEPRVERRKLPSSEIAAMLQISVKTASPHVSHILRKLDAPNRREAAEIAHRLVPPLDDGGRVSV